MLERLQKYFGIDGSSAGIQPDPEESPTTESSQIVGFIGSMSGEGTIYMPNGEVINIQMPMEVQSFEVEKSTDSENQK